MSLAAPEQELGPLGLGFDQQLQIEQGGGPLPEPETIRDLIIRHLWVDGQGLFDVGHALFPLVHAGLNLAPPEQELGPLWLRFEEWFQVKEGGEPLP